jgi:hypothetical protein
VRWFRDDVIDHVRELTEQPRDEDATSQEKSK